jgi:hypothetical protein
MSETIRMWIEVAFDIVYLIGLGLGGRHVSPPISGETG